MSWRSNTAMPVYLYMYVYYIHTCTLPHAHCLPVAFKFSLLLRSKVGNKCEKDGGSPTLPDGVSPEGDKRSESEGVAGGGDEGSGEGDQEDSVDATPQGPDISEGRNNTSARERRLDREKRRDASLKHSDGVVLDRVPLDVDKASEEEEERIPRAPSTGSIGGGDRRPSKPLAPFSSNVSTRKRASQTLKSSSRVSPLSPPPLGSLSQMANATTPTSSPRKGRKEDGWKEVGRR